MLPIHEAARANKLDCFKFLLKRGGKVSDSDNYGRSPLHHAAVGGGLSCLHHILEMSVSPNIVDSKFL